MAVYMAFLARIELGVEMKKNMKEKDADIRILVNERNSLKDRLLKIEVSFFVFAPLFLPFFVFFRNSNC